MVVYDKDWGYVLNSEPQTLRHCLNFYRCHSTSTNQQAGDKIGRESPVFLCIHGILPDSWSVAFLVCGGGGFFSIVQRKNTRASSFHHCFTILRLGKCGILYACFHVLEKKGEA